MTLTELGCCRRITGQLYRGNILQSYVKTRITQFIATMTLWIITQLRVCVVYSASYCIGLNVVSLINYTHRKAMWSSKNECCWFGLTNKTKTTTNTSWTVPSTNRSAVEPLQMNALTLILRRSRTGTVRFYTSTSNKRAARPKLYTKSLTRDLKRMYSRFTLVRISIKL